MTVSSSGASKATLGTDYGSNLYSGGCNLQPAILPAAIWESSVNVVDSTVDSSSQNELGFNTNVNYSRRFGAMAVDQATLAMLRTCKPCW